ncbi:MAG: hypothetical protein EXR04_06460 [Rhodospirillales bacterium]|nr:hypothetical protein [Rhodospirillales bacterium]
MDYVIGAVLIADVYALVYYRLLVRHFLEQDDGVKETGFFALLAPPPRTMTSGLARKYAKRYYAALAVLAACFAAIAATTDFRTLTSAG